MNVLNFMLIKGVFKIIGKKGYYEICFFFFLLKIYLFFLLIYIVFIKWYNLEFVDL